MNLFNNNLNNWLRLSQLSLCSLRVMSKRLMSSIDGKYMKDLKDMNEEEVVDNELVFEDLTPKQFESLAQNEQQLNEIELILSHYEYLKYCCHKIPSTLTIKDMKRLLALKSKSSRNKYFNTLYNNQMKGLIELKRKSLNKELKEMELKKKWTQHKGHRTGIFNTEGDIVYGLWHNSLFTRISESNTRRQAIHRLRNGSLFGQNIVFDLSFGEQLSPKDCHLIANEMSNCFALNRNRFAEPFNLHFCNIDYKSIIWQTIEQKLAFNKSSHFVNCTQNSYLDLFEDKSKLVYISSKAKNDLNFDHNCVYILGAFVERNEPLLTLKARELKIRAERLPIDKHIIWNCGYGKSLQLNQTFSILNDLRNGIKWREAFQRNINPISMKTPEMIAEEDCLRFKKLRSKIDVKQLLENE